MASVIDREYVESVMVNAVPLRLDAFCHGHYRSATSGKHRVWMSGAARRGRPVLKDLSQGFEQCRGVAI